MNMLVVLAIFLASSTVIVACLDHLKMYVARNLFFVLVVVLFLGTPFILWGDGIVRLHTEQHTSNLVLDVIEVSHMAYSFSHVAFTSITALSAILALFVSVATAIVVVHTARAICKWVKNLNSKQPRKRPSKQNFEPKLAHTKIQYKRILYLRLCRLNS